MTKKFFFENCLCTVTQWYKNRLIILRVRVQILPLALGERKGQKILRILVVYCNTVVEYFTHNPKIESSKPTTGCGREINY